jgi:hypothetical protein
MAFRIEGALRFPIWSPTPREVSVWVVKPLRGEWHVLHATELSAETRFSSKIMSPSFAFASVIGLSGGVNDLIVSAEKRGAGGGCCAGAETAVAKKTSTGIVRRFILSPMIAIVIVSKYDTQRIQTQKERGGSEDPPLLSIQPAMGQLFLPIAILSSVIETFRPSAG